MQIKKTSFSRCLNLIENFIVSFVCYLYLNWCTNPIANTPPNVVSNISEIEYFAPKYFFWQNSQ